MGSSSRGGGDTETTTKSEPWGPAGRELQALFEQLGPYRTGAESVQQFEGLGPGGRLGYAGDILGTDPSTAASALGLDPALMQSAIQYGFVPVSPERREAYGTAQDVLGASTAPALGQLASTAGGEYLGANPYLDEMYGAATAPMIEQFQTEILPAMTGQFAGSGNYGSSGHEFFTQQAGKNMERVLGETAARIYAPAYESERDRMLRAAGLTPSVAQPFIQSSIGLAGLDEQELGELMGMLSSGYGFQSQEPLARMQQLANIYGGTATIGGSGTQSEPYYTNPWLQGAGLGLGAAGTAAMLGAGGPAAAAIGGGAALLPLLFGM